MTTDDLQGGQQVVQLNGRTDEAGAAQHRSSSAPERRERLRRAQSEHPGRDIATGCGEKSHPRRSRSQGRAGNRSSDKASVAHTSGGVLIGPAFERKPQLLAEVRKQRDTIDQHSENQEQIVSASEMSLLMRQKGSPFIGLERGDHRRTDDDPAPRSRLGERERPI
ncbi:MAG: hypothetical protein O3C27_02165 [Actinomycetota bacterium]|nr:hypothetical protein [Actinomycetota bacterium]